MRNKIIAILLLFCIAASFVGCTSFKDRQFQVTETYTVMASKGNISYLEVALPVSYGYQRISNLRIENVDDYTLEDGDGYRVLLASIIGDGTEKTVRITYDVELLSGNMGWQDTEMLPGYTRASRLVDSDNTEIRNVVQPLIVAGDDMATAQKIHQFTVKTIKTDTTPKENQTQLTASQLLENPSGVCQDYAILMTALLRAAGIPAREITGLAFSNLGQGGDWSHPASAHAWVEFYADGAWHFADPTWGKAYFDKADGVHLSYGTLPTYVQDSARYMNQLEKLEKAGFTVLGQMTAPMFFTCWTTDSKATLTPGVAVTAL